MGSERDGMMKMLFLMNNIQVQICVFSIVIKQLSFCIEFKLKVQARMMKQCKATHWSWLHASNWVKRHRWHQIPLAH